MTWRTGPVGIEQRAIVADNGIVYAIGESFTSASKIVRALNESDRNKELARQLVVQRDTIEALAKRLTEEEGEMQANMAAGTSPWVTRAQLSREDVIGELRRLLRVTSPEVHLPIADRGVVQVRFEPPASSPVPSFSIITRPGSGERHAFPPGYAGGTVDVTWA